MITEVFAFKARKEAEANGMAALPIVIIPHPVGQLPSDEVRAIADTALDEILDGVLRSRETLASRYRGRTGRRASAGDGR